jgi:pimeloyl-ACP methyl ester carboxylesterase
MKWQVRVLPAGLILGGCLAAASVPVSAPPGVWRYQPQRPRQAITESLETLRDEGRRRDVPIKLYAPEAGAGPFPVILFSHGLGSSRQGYSFLGREWASRGYVSIHLQHVASDSEVLRTRGLLAIYRAAFDAAEYADRSFDIRFVLDELGRRQGAAAPGSLWSKLDLGRVGVAGHSYGAHTALTVAGMLVNFPDHPHRSFRDERVRAALVLSPPVMEWSPGPAELEPVEAFWDAWLGRSQRARDWLATVTPSGGRLERRDLVGASRSSASWRGMTSFRPRAR